MQYLYLQRLLSVWSVWLLAVVTVYAQVDTATYHTLSEVEVVAKSRPSVTRQGAPLQVVDRVAIERLGIQDLSEAVKRFSGVTVQDYGGIGGLKTVSVRNLGAKHTAVSYDGVSITDAQSGQVDISRFSLDDVEMVSLSVGQTDDIFQTARMYASAGALRIKTMRPDFTTRPFRIKAQLKAGSFGLVNPYLRYEQKIGKRFAASGQVDWLRADGNYPFILQNGTQKELLKRKNSDIQSLRTEVNVFGDLGRAGSLSVKGYYFDSERGLPGSVILYNEYSGERIWDKNAFAQAHYQAHFTRYFALQAQTKFNYTWSKYVHVNNNFENGFQEDLHTQREYYGSVSGLYTPSEQWGFSLTTDFFVNTLRNNLPDCPFPTRYTSLSVVAAQYQNSRLSATVSVLHTYMTEQVERGERPADRKRFSPTVSASWRILPDQNLRVRAFYKDIFRVPTFNDMYYLRIGNTNLKPERATQYNLGLAWSGELCSSLPLLSLSVDGYYNRVRDKIVAIPTLYIWKMMNMGEVTMGGIDVNLSAEVPLYRQIKMIFQGAYTWQHVVDITDKTAKNYGDQIPYTPRHAGSVSLSVDNPWVNVSYSLTAVGNRYALPQNIADNLIKRYVEQSLSVNRMFAFGSCKLRLQGEIVNLGNIMYDVIQFYPMPGRSYRASVVFTF